MKCELGNVQSNMRFIFSSLESVIFLSEEERSFFSREGRFSEEEARQLLTPLPLGARQSKEGQKAAGLGVRQAGVWIPAQQLEPM